MSTILLDLIMIDPFLAQGTGQDGREDHMQSTVFPLCNRL